MQPNGNPRERIQVLLPLLLATALVMGVLIGMRVQTAFPRVVVESPDAVLQPVSGESKLEELLRYIEAKYVDEVDRDELVDQAIEAILKELDPHSSYIPKDALKRTIEQLEGEFEGIGIEFMFLDDTVVVLKPIPDSPADLAGIQAGDRIIEVEDSLVAGQGLSDQQMVGLLKGEKGSSVKLGILRRPESKIRYFQVSRDDIPVNSVDAAYMLTDQVGYIRINRFTATTDREFITHLETLVDRQGMKDLILDLRNNPGGYLQKASNLLSQLFPEKDKLLVYTEGRSSGRADYKTTGRSFYRVGAIAVLVDENSASAAEIVAGAVQDQDRGVIVGRRSFGKGLVQEQYLLHDGSALRLTIARYYTPSGRSIQKAYDDPDAYEHDLDQRLDSGELLSDRYIRISDSTEYFTRSGRTVYGGGGIIPDVFVPFDTLLLDPVYLQLEAAVPNFMFRHLEDWTYPVDDLTAFRAAFSVDGAMMQQFLDYAQVDTQRIPPVMLEKMKRRIRQAMEALAARTLFGEEAYYMVMNEGDEMVQTALQVLRQGGPMVDR